MLTTIVIILVAVAAFLVLLDAGLDMVIACTVPAIAVAVFIYLTYEFLPLSTSIVTLGYAVNRLYLKKLSEARNYFILATLAFIVAVLMEVR